ncbi:MAG: hypothetical protein POELPBGB_01170 [Bacteroidia bacterium]|nr:hypothetical protein [Bacteroidia bacterium]
MTSLEIELKLSKQNYIEIQMLESAFDFWFKDHEHIRSPFPDYVKDDLQQKSIDKFLEWSNQISEKARKDINDEILAEKFEEILFELGDAMVKSVDEKLTIKYPFMPRVNDIIKVKDVPDDEAESSVTSREICKIGDETFMKIKLKNLSSGTEWETDFELPE